MIWYLLYPFRGTTVAPELPPTHPLCAVFSRYARYAASHVVSTLLISGVVATIFSYPIPYLFTHDLTNGASIIPYHVWTVAQPLPRNAKTEPDIIMRSIWVHADYMQALNQDLLSSALELQNELLGPTVDFDPTSSAGILQHQEHSRRMSVAQRDAVHAANGLTNQSWMFHSPLMYWNCSNQLILADPDIIGTVNDKKNQSTASNITLRHSLVFSGKSFEDRRLLAADALVITLLHLRDSPVGRQWQQVAPLLPGKVGDKWDVYPKDGHVSNSHLYEFQFRPISSHDMVSLAIAYGLALLYFLMSLSKLKAIKSKTGLTITVVTQIVFSIMSSFTLCAVFDIDLSRIPRAAYPLVVLAMSLENIFRLINAVIVTPSDESSSIRVGQAFGHTAPTALESTTQNVLILLGLSRLVSPGVANFCIFAAIAIVFDFFYLSTFFLAVLSVDVRRMELGEALARATSRYKRNTSVPRDRTSWLGHFIRGKVALSTRIAGTVIMVGFVIIAQLHFFGEGRRLFGPTDLGSLSFQGKDSILADVHQARSPTSWLRLQDHETAREVIRVIKPTAYSYTARVFDPLVFVLKGSDRMPHRQEHNLLPAAYDFANHQLTHFVTFILLVGAGLRLLTSYLLWEDEEDEEDDEAENMPHLSLKTFSDGHSLDILMMTSSSDGCLASVGLDRNIRIWDIRNGSGNYSLPDADADGSIDLFPVLGLAIDASTTTLAIVGSSQVRYWSLQERNWLGTVAIEELPQKPELVFFDSVASEDEKSLIIVRRDGSLTEILETLDNYSPVDVRICSVPVVSARQMLSKGDKSCPRQCDVLILSKKGTCFKSTKRDGGWSSNELPLEGFASKQHVIHRIELLTPLPIFVAASRSAVHLVRIDNGQVVHSIDTEWIVTRSLQCSITQVRQSVNSGIAGITSFTLCYLDERTQECVIRQFTPRQDREAILLRINGESHSDRSASSQWCTWESAQETSKRVANAGKWNVVAGGRVIGIRRQQSLKPLSNGTNGGLRQRMSRRDAYNAEHAQWEVWTSAPGNRPDTDETQPLFEKQGKNSDYLVISELGPISKVATKSVAFCFGHVIKVATVGGQERYDSETESSNDAALSVGSRRRRYGGGASRSRG